MRARVASSLTDPLRVALAAVRLARPAGPTIRSASRPSSSPPPTPAGGQGSSSSPLAVGMAGLAQVGRSASPAQPVTRPFISRPAVDVLAALQRGRSNKWIANHLNLSENTVKVHIRHIMRKLNATNRTQAVIYSQTPSASHRDPGVVPSSASRVPESGL